MEYKIEQMTSQLAQEIVSWEYENPYDIYNMNRSKEALNELLEGQYFCVTYADKLIGYFCYGSVAQIPIKEALDKYSDNSYIDIGLGLKPDLCGIGHGLNFVKAGIDFAVQKYNTDNFRLTVASFNKRAIKTYTKVGFKSVDSFVRIKDSVKFNIMVLEAKD